MKIHFTITKQQLKRNDNEILASYSKNFVYCCFCCSNEWEHLYKKALFTDVSNKKFIVDLGFGKKVLCKIPNEVLQGNYFSVSVFGGDRLTTTQETILLQTSGFSKNISNVLEDDSLDYDSDTLVITSDVIDKDRPRLVSCFNGYTILKNPQHDEHLYF